MFDVIIIGAGPAGLTAAVYAIRAGLKPLVLEAMMYGGQVGNTAEVENFPSIQKISGWQLAANIYQQAVALGADIRFEAVQSVDFSGTAKRVITNRETHEAHTVIIANGAKRRLLECPGEVELTGRGVSYCATCDGAFFKDQTTAVIGGGNTALEDALFLANLCPKVYLVHRRDEFRADQVLIDAVKKTPNIEFLPSHTVLQVQGEQSVTGLLLQDKKADASVQLPLNGVFVAIGMIPDNSLFAGEITLDEAGYIVADESCCTNVKGVYVAGDTRTKFLRQIITAAADGAIAATQAAHYIHMR